MEQRVAEIAQNTAYTASITTVVIGGLALQDWAIIIGIVATVATFILNWAYRQKHFKLAQARAEHGELERRACKRPKKEE